MRNERRVVTRTMLLEHVWEFHFDPQTNVIDVHISCLRAKNRQGLRKTAPTYGSWRRVLPPCCRSVGSKGVLLRVVQNNQPRFVCGACPRAATGRSQWVRR